MATRSSYHTVSFRQPFTLMGIPQLIPPGAYGVDTEEESIDGLSFVAWHRVSTTILLYANGASQAFAVDPVDLEASLLRDRGVAFSQPIFEKHATLEPTSASQARKGEL
jgi:hypothetical protein